MGYLEHGSIYSCNLDVDGDNDLAVVTSGSDNI
jgi:hypothetical protein